MKRVFPASFYNLLTVIGLAVVVVSLGLILFMGLLEAMAKSPKPYVGIIAFVILPAILLVGIGIMIAGVVREHRRQRKGLSKGMHLPQIDLNNPRHRRATVVVVAGSVLLLMLSAFGSFQAYEHTDSDEFCGETCHTVMEPEYTAYQFSPHARVGCAKCHIGPGAGWFVRSKLSGAYQVYAALFDKFPRPIPTPIQNLRPAQETCEQCHWPKHFYSEKLHVNKYYMGDEENTEWMLELLMKIGGGNVEAGPTSGIHWHMNIAHKVEYVALDNARQTIPVVSVTNPDGTKRTYRNHEIDITDDSLSRMPTRTMDCIDCHNRPSHIYHPGARSTNHLMSLGWIDPELPYVKSKSVEVLETEYSTRENARDSIDLLIREFYKSEYPEIEAAKKEQIERTIEQLQNIYSRSYFPEMTVNWKRFTDNIGHFYYPGCFRCHDGKHESDDGKVLSRDCNACHTILAQEMVGDSLRVSLGGVDYKHPVDIGEIWKEMNCSDCHNPT